MIAAKKKRETRKSVQQSAWMTLDGGFATRPCVVIDLSSTGAKITVDDAGAAPAGFRLAFSRDTRSGRKCEVIWRRGRTLGVKFVR
jgi:PilZ domain-containing protein